MKKKSASHRITRRLVALGLAGALAVTALLSARDASAEPGMQGLSVDWAKLGAVLRDGLEVLAPPPPREAIGSASAAASGAPMTLSMPSARDRIFGVAPSFSLVARDWGGSQLLAGEASVIDHLRLTRSIRMVVSRVLLAQGIVRPFAQVGLGQWRVDTDLLPAMPRDTEAASQLGGGVEISLLPMWGLALEADYTILYREQYEPQRVTGPHLFGAFLASRARF